MKIMKMFDESFKFLLPEIGEALIKYPLSKIKDGAVHVGPFQPQMQLSLYI
jgi:hypothetical protein